MIPISIQHLKQQKFICKPMVRPIYSPSGARNPILANIKILARFYQKLSYSLTFKVTSLPILTKSFDAHTYTLTTYWQNRTFMKEGIFSLRCAGKRDTPF